jgi:hypothetical protein
VGHGKGLGNEAKCVSRQSTDVEQLVRWENAPNISFNPTPTASLLIVM